MRMVMMDDDVRKRLPRDWVESAQCQTAVDSAHQANSSKSLQTADDLSSLTHIDITSATNIHRNLYYVLTSFNDIVDDVNLQTIVRY